MEHLSTNESELRDPAELSNLYRTMRMQLLRMIARQRISVAKMINEDIYNVASDM